MTNYTNCGTRFATIVLDIRNEYSYEAHSHEARVVKNTNDRFGELVFNQGISNQVDFFEASSEDEAIAIADHFNRMEAYQVRPSLANIARSLRGRS